MDSSTYNVALFFHLLGALLFVAGIVLAGAAFEAARRRQQPAEIALLLSMTRIGVLLVAVGALLLAAFGLWLVHLGSWGYGSGWVAASMVLYAVALALGDSAVSGPSRPGSWRAAWPSATPRSATSCAPCSTTPSRGPRTTLRCWWCS